MAPSRPHRSPNPDAAPDAPAAPPTKSALNPASLGLETAATPSAAASPNGFPFLAPPQAAEELGRLGPYRVLDVLGQGGMGVVFRAEDPKLRRQVALKVMLPQFAANPLAVQRFLREARNQAAVEHDHVIPIFQADEDTAGTPFIAMPLLKGQTLAAALRQNPRPPLAEVLRVGREVAEGLAAAHDQGLIHRDIKPGNIWLEGARRRVKVLDFGLARAEAEQAGDADGEPLTASGVVVGTPLYMSPEQARGEAVDHRTDLFALGVVLYQMTTGRLPFNGPSTMAILTSLAIDAPRPPADLAPDVPPRLNALILALLEKHPADRPPAAQAVADELRRIEGGVSQTLVAIPLGAVPAADDPWAAIDATSPDEVVHAPALTRTPKAPVKVPRWAWAVAAAVGLVAVGLAAWQVITITTPHGKLIVELDRGVDPNVEIVVKKDGAVIHDRTKQREIELRTGEYGIELAEKDGLKLNAKTFTITRNGRAAVKVSLDRSAATMKPPLATGRPTDGPEQKTGSPAFQEAHGVARDALLAWAAKLPAGYRPTWYAARAGDPHALFDAVAAPVPGDAGWKFAINPEGDTREGDELVKTHRPMATVFHRSGTDWAALILAVRDGDEWEFWFGDADFMAEKIKGGLTFERTRDGVRQRWLPTSVTAYQKDSLTYDMHMAWLPYREVEWHPDLGPAELTAKVAEYRAKGWRPHLVGAHHNRTPTRFLAVFTDDPSKEAWDFTPDLTVANYEKELSARGAKGQRPRCVCSHEADGKVGYTVVWDGGTAAPPADPDRKAAEAFIPYADLALADPMGKVISLKAGDPLPAGQFTVTGIGVKQPFPKDFMATAISLLSALGHLSTLYDSGPVWRSIGEDMALVEKLTRSPVAISLIRFECTFLPLSSSLVESLSRCPKLATLSFDAKNATDNDLAALAKLPSLKSANIRDLGQSPGTTRHGLKAVTDLPLMGMELIHPKVLDEQLARSIGMMPNLRHLRLLDTSFDDRQVREFVAGGCPNLVSITILHGDVTDEGLKALDGVPTLTSLTIKETKVTKASLEKLAAVRPDLRIEWDDGVMGPTEGGPLPPDPAAVRRAAEWLTDRGAVVFVSTGANRMITHRSAAEVPAKAGLLAGFNFIYQAKGGGVTEAAVLDLLERTPGRFQVLGFGGVPLTDEGLRRLAALSAAATARSLTLSGPGVTDAGARHLSALGGLTTLTLRKTRLTDEGLKALANLPALTNVDVKETRVTAAGVKAFAAARPACKIEWDGSSPEPAKK